MMPTKAGAIRLFRAAGIDVWLHWSWFLVAAYQIQRGGKGYSSLLLLWSALEYLALFALVMLHEFGHALACRQVGGQANQIVLWPLGGVAYVSPPQRPGATLWSIAAGPLVNVALTPVFIGLLIAAHAFGWATAAPNAFALLAWITSANVLLLVFNLLPIYPLDGGQILRSLLWFLMGRARSLMVATVIGFAGVGAVVLLAWAARSVWGVENSVWIGIVAAFMLLNCQQGFRYALALMQMARLPRRPGFACPECRAAPPTGAHWICGRCRKPFDTFATNAVCPHCGAAYTVTQCLNCQGQFPIEKWAGPPPLPQPQ